jgi:hypothetical protein
MLSRCLQTSRLVDDITSNLSDVFSEALPRPPGSPRRLRDSAKFFDGIFSIWVCRLVSLWIVSSF